MQLVKKFSRLLINALTMNSLPGPFTHIDGRGWSAHLPQLAHLANQPNAQNRSTLALYEDGVPIGPAHASRSEIVARGEGRYQHLGPSVVFSASDNSNPNGNGRTYTYPLSPWLFRRRTAGLADGSDLPGNFQLRDTSPERIKADIDYTLQAAERWLQEARRFSPATSGMRILEVGPGINYGAVMVLACHGMVPLVSDRFLSAWQEDYHRPFYEGLAREVARRDPAADVTPLRQLLAAGGYDERIITCVTASLEEMPLDDNSIDMIFSNAVVEHLYNVDRSFAQLYRITRPGGFGLHQVDFRDHRNFDRPLEYLLLEEEEFQRQFAAALSEVGNRYRPAEVSAWIEAAGFEVLTFDATEHGDPDYVAEFLPRLRAASRSRYRHLQAEDLHVLGGCYRLRKSS